MARSWKSRPSSPPTSITEIARRYHAAAVALAQTLGLSVPEVLAQHRESVTAIFIECGKCEIRLPVGIKLPPLATPPADATNGHAVIHDQAATNSARSRDQVATKSELSPDHVMTAADLPTRIPAGLQLPCADALLTDLRPPQLSLLIGKVGLRALADKTLAPLHLALLRERARRFEAHGDGA